MLIISGSPWRTNLSNLQYSLCAMAFFLLGMYLTDRGHPILAGVMYSLSLFKVHMIVPMLVILIAGKCIKEFITIIVTQIIEFIAALIWFKDFNMLTFDNLDLILYFEGGASGFVDINCIINNGIIKYLIVAVIAVLMVLLSFVMMKQREHDELEYGIYFSFILICMLIMLYHRIYDYFLFVIPLVYMYR